MAKFSVELHLIKTTSYGSKTNVFPTGNESNVVQKRFDRKNSAELCKHGWEVISFKE